MQIHTLGPAGTNCEAAAKFYLQKINQKGGIFLHSRLEKAITYISSKNNSVLLSCAAYPDLHHLIFSNTKQIEIFDAFVFKTYNMVLASVNNKEVTDVSTHPAPQSLCPDGTTKHFSSSNSQAAYDCLSGKTNGCITTEKSSNKLGLTIKKDFGAIPMVFILHREAI